MGLSAGATTLVNSFSLVAYLPEPLARFVDELRRDVQPGCTARSHVTLLPPRPIGYPVEQACSEIESVLRFQPSFDVELGKVCVFPVSKVVHISIEEGALKLSQLNRYLNKGACTHSEFFLYHPHVTLAQGIMPDTVDDAAALATRRWDGYSGPRNFQLDTLTLVQNTVDNEWQNLREFTLRTPEMAWQ
jgi:2'-5' RNA ligase